MKQPVILIAAALVALSTAAVAQPVAAQVSVELRGSLQRPTGDFANDANGDFGLGGDVMFGVSPMISVYGGYGLASFSCDGCSDDEGYKSKGFEAGAKFLFASTRSILPWARAGATLHKLEIQTQGVTATSDRKVGLQASVGLDIPLGETLSFSPAIRYQTWQAEFSILNDAIIAQRDVSFLSLDFGLHIHPGR